jgi:2-aminobenzoate-CoA ligase
MIRSAYRDTFARDNLPPASAWPDLIFALPDLNYPERLNVVSHLLDRWIADGHGE